jgi:hypothetical protein
MSTKRDCCEAEKAFDEVHRVRVLSDWGILSSGDCGKKLSTGWGKILAFYKESPEIQKTYPQIEFEFCMTRGEGLDSTKSREIEDQLYDMLVWFSKVA